MQLCIGTPNLYACICFEISTYATQYLKVYLLWLTGTTVLGIPFANGLIYNLSLFQCI